MERARRWFVYNLWYLGKPPWDTGIAPPELREFIASHPPGRALDLGCGTGRNLLELAQSGWQVTGVDFAVKAVRQARKRLRKAGLPGEVILGSVTDLRPVTGKFDLVLDIGCYHSLSSEDQAEYRRNVTERISSEGFFLMYAHLKDNDNQPGTSISEEGIQRLSQGFIIVKREDSHDRWERRATWITFKAAGNQSEGEL